MKQLLATLLVLIPIASLIDARWCNETETRNQVRTVHYTEEVTKHRNNVFCKFRFTKHSRKCTYKESQPRQREESYQVDIAIPKCCPGYTKEESPLQCTPICDPKCINSVCVEPNKCDCLDDYMRSKGELMDHKCHECDCLNGHCSRGQCLCNAGYEKNVEDDLCALECPVECGSGRCSLPNVCEVVTTERVLQETTTPEAISEMKESTTETTTYPTSTSDQSTTNARAPEEVFLTSTAEIDMNLITSSSPLETPSTVTPSTTMEYESETVTGPFVVQDGSEENEEIFAQDVDVTQNSTVDEKSIKYLGLVVVGIIIVSLILIFVVMGILMSRGRSFTVIHNSDESSVQYFADPKYTSSL